MLHPRFTSYISIPQNNNQHCDSMTAVNKHLQKHYWKLSACLHLLAIVKYRDSSGSIVKSTGLTFFLVMLCLSTFETQRGEPKSNNYTLQCKIPSDNTVIVWALPPLTTVVKYSDSCLLLCPSTKYKTTKALVLTSFCTVCMLSLWFSILCCATNVL